jgi:uncharacterized protein (TIGR03000 family)
MTKRTLVCWLPGLALAAVLALADVRPGYGSYPGIPDKPVAARITLHVPADAEVWFDGQLTTETGSERKFSSPPVDPQRHYAYEVRVRWREGSEVVERTRQVRFHGGEKVTVDFLDNGKATTAQGSGGK